MLDLGFNVKRKRTDTGLFRSGQITHKQSTANQGIKTSEVVKSS